MRTNPVKQSLMENRSVLGSWVMGSQDPSVAPTLARAGFDFFIIDMEHVPYGLETAARIIWSARQVGIVPLVRVPGPQYEWIARALDAGAMGIMVPRVEEVEVVKAVVGAAKYPPEGVRGVGLGGANTDYEPVPLSAGLLTSLNAQTLVIIQIESRTAVDRLDDLLGVGGVDVAFIGPADLSTSLGVPGQYDHPKVVEAINAIKAGAERHHVAVGAHTFNLSMLLDFKAQGMRCLTFGSDRDFILMAGQQAVQAFKEGRAPS